MSLQLPRVSNFDQDTLCLGGAMAGVLTVGNTFAGRVFSVWTSLPRWGGGIFGAVLTVGTGAAFFLDQVTNATKCFGDSSLATIARLALYILVGASIAAAVVALSGYSITIADAAILTTTLTVFDVVVAALSIACA